MSFTSEKSSAAVGVADASHTTATVTSWQPPVVWKHTCIEDSVAPLLPGSKLHVHEQLKPDGSRAHSCIYGSPGGTTHVEQHTSPAGAVRAGLARKHPRVERPLDERPDFYEHRCAFRISSVRARGRWASSGLIDRYRTQCAHCLRWQHTPSSPPPPLLRPLHPLRPLPHPHPYPHPHPHPHPFPRPYNLHLTSTPPSQVEASQA